jgi:hypothetical protein
MNRFAALSFIAAISACDAPSPESDDVVSLDDKSDSVSSAYAALPAGAEHLYFGTPLGAYVDDDSPLSYSWFTANKGGELTVSVSEDDGEGRGVSAEHIGFKLQRAEKRNGKWTFVVVKQANGDNGEASVTNTPSSGPGLYLVTTTASPLPAQLTVVVKCGGDKCSTAQQPGDTCGGRGVRPCDQGLFCSYSYAASCGAADQQGVCSVESKICPLFFSPVCGCDGQTYGNTCQAGSAGTSPARVGGCDVNVVGSWGCIDKAHYDYSFSADGTFSSEVAPACRFTPPYCAIVTREKTGNYHIYDTNLVLNYDDGSSATFTVSKRHLTGSDYSVKLDLTRN